MSTSHSTTDYKQFRIAKGNRPVMQKHVDRLKKSISKKNLLHLNPIVVSAAMEIIDGQHRCAAARQLKLPVYYIVDGGVSDADIASLNSNKRNWAPIDYINYFAAHGRSDYERLKQFIQTHSEYSVPTLIALCSSQPRPQMMLREGLYAFDNEKIVDNLLNMSADFKDYFRFYTNPKFLSALKHCNDSGEYDHNRMLLQLERQPGKLIMQANPKQFIQLLEEIYNYRKVDTANFRLTKAAREKKQRDRERELNWVAKQKPVEVTEINPGKEGARTKIRLDSKTVVYTKPGTDINQTIKKFKDHAKI